MPTWSSSDSSRVWLPARAEVKMVVTHREQQQQQLDGGFAGKLMLSMRLLKGRHVLRSSVQSGA